MSSNWAFREELKLLVTALQLHSRQYEYKYFLGVCVIQEKMLSLKIKMEISIIFNINILYILYKYLHFKQLPPLHNAAAHLYSPPSPHCSLSLFL